MSEMTTFSAACKCEANNFSFSTPVSDLPLPLDLCHCSTCRTSMGTSFGTFYLPAPFSYGGAMRPFAAGEVPPTLTRASSDTAARYFCSKCGAHMLMHYGGEDALTPFNGDQDEWWVCSGVVDGDLSREISRLFKTVAQIWVDGTNDGGLAYLAGHTTSADVERVPAHETGSISPQSPVIPLTSLQERLRRFIPSPSSSGSIRDETLIAQCHCHSTTILLSRPDVPSSYPPTTRDGPGWHESLDRPEGADEVWWLRPSMTDPSKRDRLATIPCACTDCRKCTGSETVSWTYTPTSCISVVLRPKVSAAARAEVKVVPWSTIASYVRSFQPISTATSIMESLHGELEGYRLPFRVYNSSKDTYRGFCGTCGATIFWYGPQGGDRDNMIDLSAALFSDPSLLDPGITQATHFSGNDSLAREQREVGSRRDDWLDWLADRVTFFDSAEGRGDLVERMGEGLKSQGWGEGLTL